MSRLGREGRQSAYGAGKTKAKSKTTCLNHDINNLQYGKTTFLLSLSPSHDGDPAVFVAISTSVVALCACAEITENVAGSQAFDLLRERSG